MIASAPATAPRSVGTLLFAAACAWSIAKGQAPVIHFDEFYFWFNTYGHGYVRRGLVGTLLYPIVGGVPPEALRHGVAGLHILFLAGFAVLVFRAATRGLGRGWPVDEFLIAMLLACSPFLEQLAHHTGYPDDLIAIALCGSAAWLRRGGGPGLAAMLLASCLVHELLFLLLLPMVVFHLALRGETGRRDMAWIGLSVIVAALLTVTAHPAGAPLVHALVGAVLSPEAAQSQIDESLSRSLSVWLAMMGPIWRDNAANAAMGLVYAGLPSVLIVLLGRAAAWQAIAERTSRGGMRFVLVLLYVASGMAGCAVLAIALDLSRITSFTTLTAFLTTCLLPRPATRRRPNAALLTGSVCVIACTALMPMFDLHFPWGRVANLARVGVVCPPCASAGRGFFEFYDRGVAPSVVHRIEADPFLGNR